MTNDSPATIANTSAISATTPAVTAVKAAFPYLALYLLAIGTFAIGTEGFMIAAILPKVAGSLAVSLQAAGQLVTIFALTYALSSPILTALTSHVDRRKFLIIMMGVFAVGNLVAAVASNYWFLAVARVILAIAAGLYMPTAGAVAGTLVTKEQRGRAIAIISGGMTVSLAFGVPLGAFIGNHLSWRMTFVGVAILALIACVGLIKGLPRNLTPNHITTLRERFMVIRQPNAFLSLLVTTLWGIGAYTIYTYINPYMTTVVGIAQDQISYILFFWGFSAFMGLYVGGRASDKLGPHRIMSFVFPLMTVALTSLSLVAWFLTPSMAMAPVLVIMFIWGFFAWGSFPAQQARLIGIVGIRHAPIILSLNASFMYLGFSMGAALGSLVLTHGSVADLGWVGGCGFLVSTLLFFFTKSREKQTVA